MEQQELESSVSQGFSLFQWPTPPSWGWGQVPNCWSRSTEGQVQDGSIPSQCVLSPIPAPAQLPQRGTVLEQEGLEQAFGMGVGLGSGCDVPSSTWNPGILLMWCLHKGQVAAPAPFRCHLGSGLA